ncbi:MAG: DEAD/DEAH box helicase [Asgard group archaeon]|nr:DEAD/DEAH box helicase [Asgard group archaeon]
MVIESQQTSMFKEIAQKILQKKQIHKLTDIQKKAFPFIAGDENLVIVAPSGAGKTLIAELVTIMDLERYKQPSSINELSILSNNALKTKTVFLVPLRALADEKARNFAINYREYKLNVHLSMSDVDFNEEKIDKCDVLISTYERFKTILGRLPQLVNAIRNVIIDEFHLVGDESRGQVLETIITALYGNVRLILLSATIANPEDIAKWLDARLVYSDKRFIPLDYTIIPTLHPEMDIKKLIKKSISEKSQILIFSGTRNKSEENAIDYSEFIYDCCKNTKDFNPEQIKSLLQQYSIPQNTVGNKLIYDLVQNGTAFHHAGLSGIAKKLIEEMFRRRWIKVLFCTETLGAGINLPARDVVIADTKRWNDNWLSRNVFHQIAGRAGRPDFDVYGKCSILVVDSQEKREIMNRYWKNDENTNNPLRDLKPQFDVILSKIISKDEFERMILAFIYSRKPTKEELLDLLVNSYHNFIHWNNVIDFKARNNSRVFYEMILDFRAEMLDESLTLLSKLYSINGLKIGEILEDDEKQIIEVANGQTKSYVTLNNSDFYCSCNVNDLFCKHRLFVLQQLPKKISCKILSEKFSILQNLTKNDYIYEKSSGNYHTTTKGTIWAEMGLMRTKFEYLREWLIYDLYRKSNDLATIMNECLRVMQINSSDFYLSYIEFRKPLFDYIIKKSDFIDVIRKYQIYEGDLFRVIVALKSLIAGLIPLSEFLGLVNIKQKLEILDLLITDTILRK